MGHQLHMGQKGIYMNHSRFNSDSQRGMRADVIKTITRQLSSLGSSGSTTGSSNSRGSSMLITDNPCSVPACVSRSLITSDSKVCASLK